MPDRSSTFTTLICVLLVLAFLGCDRSSPEAKKAKHREQAATYFARGVSIMKPDRI